MDIATAESFLSAPGVTLDRVVDSLPFPFVILFFFACLTCLFRWPSARPVLKTNLVPLPSPRGEFVYLDTPSRRLVVSATPLLPPPPPKEARVKPNKLKRLLSAYRPLRMVPEDAAEAMWGPSSPV
ncbi:hypothetical protein CspeluHIS016_0406570 [Cutaneotrichosporon spelunceum]|uniref:Uncharacterized protein n=1 Tax=Cutaneotrichosporon spelunceum TaxID=1672016 RepID=A0AAD3TVT3_9TREE|nr:hypothetical protein CspeluHIS016_0406570 [Cutaneotrichosporon spelunceum]